MQKQHLALVACFLVTGARAMEGSTAGVEVETRHDIDYQLTRLGASVSLVTPLGLFQCDPAALRGKTRVDAFNNIVGISDVRDAEWKSISAQDISCRYGAKWHLGEGVLKAGVGIRDYLGKTADEPGGKQISVEGGGALLQYESDTLDAKLEWQREIHDYRLRHNPSYGSYDSLVDMTKDTYALSTTYDWLYLKAEHVRGHKDDAYTTPLFPDNHFRYGYTDVALGLNLNPEGDGLTLVAPIIGGGSYQGSYNALSSDTGLKGIMLAGRIRGYELDFTFVRHQGEGSNPYLPATDKIHEQLTENRLSLGIKKDDWTVRLDKSQSRHQANARIIHPLYAAIIGGFGPFDNQRVEDKWDLSASFPLDKKVKALCSIYYSERQDQQYLHPKHDYSEVGGSIQLVFDY